MAEKCANRSLPPSSGVIKPKPFASLNHFTMPDFMYIVLSNYKSKNGVAGMKKPGCKKLQEKIDGGSGGVRDRGHDEPAMSALGEPASCVIRAYVHQVNNRRRLAIPSSVVISRRLWLCERTI